MASADYFSLHLSIQMKSEKSSQKIDNLSSSKNLYSLRPILSKMAIAMPENQHHFVAVKLYVLP